MDIDSWRAKDCVEWIYERAEGDIVVYARTISEAAETIMEHGFLVVNLKMIRKGQKELTDILKHDELK